MARRRNSKPEREPQMEDAKVLLTRWLTSQGYARWLVATLLLRLAWVVPLTIAVWMGHK